MTVTIVVDQLVVAPLAPSLPTAETTSKAPAETTTKDAQADSVSTSTSAAVAGEAVDTVQTVLIVNEVKSETSYEEEAAVQQDVQEAVLNTFVPAPMVSSDGNGESLGGSNASHNALAALSQLRHASLELDPLRGYANNYDSTYLWNQMNLMEEQREAYGDWSNSLVVGSSVVAASGFTLGVALWTLRAGYLVMLVSSALPSWAGFDPIPVLDHEALATRDTTTTKRQKSLAELL